MIHGYRMAGPPPHGEPPAPQPERREWPVWLGFATLFAAFLASQLVVGLLIGISGAKLDDTPAWVDMTAALVLQATLIAFAVAAAALFKPLHPWQFGLRAAPLWRAVGWSLLGLVAFYVFAAAYVALAGEPEQTTAEQIGADESALALIAAGVIFVVVAPVAEEFFFRGFFYSTLRTRLRPLLAALVNGVVFGAIHAPTGIEAVPALIALGFMLCLVREKTGSLYPCIAIHAINNTIAYASLDGVELGIALGMGTAMLLACVVVPRVAWREEPATA